jgi:hypothetical protein
MSSGNAPNRLTLDAFSDPQIGLHSGNYEQFTNTLTNPILNAKGVQLLSANIINTSLPLNDDAHLVFWYYAAASAVGIINAANLQCVRLLPSWYVPYPAFTAFTKNAIFNTVTDLVTALNAAAATGGDNVTYNGYWSANQVLFSYDATSRRISVTGTTQYIAPAAIDDPNVQAAIAGTGYGGQISMHGYAADKTQPLSKNVSMNSRLGFALKYGARGRWWGASSQVGCATATGVPQASAAAALGDAFPILLGSQNVGIYLDIVNGGGQDSQANRNLLASIPLTAPVLNVVAYTGSGVREPIIKVPSELYQVNVRLVDDQGLPFTTPANYNVEICLAITY